MKPILVLLGLFSAICLTAPHAVGDPFLLYEGTLTYTPPLDGSDTIESRGLKVGTKNNPSDGWSLRTVALHWSVSLETPTSAWHYAYSFEVSGTSYGISHFILETSPSFTNTEENFRNFVCSSPANLTFGWQESGSPGLPEPLIGIRIEPLNSPMVLTWSFDSNKQPVWGDFYAKDGLGMDPAVANYAFNVGFGSPDYDPSIEVYEPQSVSGSSPEVLRTHILRPDTEPGPLVTIPEPLSMAFLGSALAGVVGWRVRSRRKEDRNLA
ncbi:MAG TPA: PEP-CTERM sorting domain-containing protein [Planctomycetota bacterium]|nr:PEP-CTERM sorting domain-containing protein [Planctomycetota bacterium]HRR81794.1 PEP-CTERM sorting domain-containing protein [Planctomycetota bacterium]HRT94063.1 PEP-CTERM sorting domain-containing protein [Planctomycetota bacterium]